MYNNNIQDGAGNSRAWLDFHMLTANVHFPFMKMFGWCNIGRGMLGKILFTVGTGMIGTIVLQQFIGSQKFDLLLFAFGVVSGMGSYASAIIFVKLEAYGTK